MKKIKCEWDGCHSTVLFSLITKEFYSFEHDQSKLIEAGYPCKTTYESRTGATGAGWVEGDDLIPFGTYRVDCGEVHKEKMFHDYNIYGYVAWSNHSNANIKTHPVILVEQEDWQIVTSYDHMVAENLYYLVNTPKFPDYFDFKRVNTGFYWADGAPQNLRWNLYNGANVTRLNLLKFFDLAYLQYNRKYEVEERVPCTLACCGIVHLQNGYGHVNGLGYIDTWFPTIDDIINHKNFGKYTLSKYDAPDMKCIVSAKRKDTEIVVTIETYENRYGILTEYEEETDIFTYFGGQYSPPVGKLRKKLRKEWVYKKKEELVRKHTKEDCIQKLTTLADRRLSKNDSLKTGNCEFGTLQFMKSYELQEGMTAKELAEHKKLNEMLNNHGFRKTIVCL